MLASAFLFSALLNVPDTDVGEVDQDGWMFAALESMFLTLTLSVSISRRVR